MVGKRSPRGRLAVVCASAAALAAAPANAGWFPAPDGAALAALEHQIRAAHFLSMATFGPRRADIEQLAARIAAVGEPAALAEWIDAQLALPPTRVENVARRMIEDEGIDPVDPALTYKPWRDSAWWHTAVRAPDQLRQRMAWALGQIFVVSQFEGTFNQARLDGSGQPQYLGLLDYYDTLGAHAFGSYRDLLTDVALHPVMGVFLDHVGNEMPDPMRGTFPDENFARELLQLFTVGPHRLRATGQVRTQPDGTPLESYDNEIVAAFARVFTGLAFRGSAGFREQAVNLHDPMVFHEGFHDREAKRLFGGVLLPPGQPGMRDLQDALDNLFEHPNVPTFIALRLIQRFVMSNPPSGYVRRVGQAFVDDGSGERGNLAAVLRAVLLDPDARNTQRYRRFHRPYGLLVVPGGTERARLREPVLRYTAFLRAFAARSDHPTRRLLFPGAEDLGQLPFRARDVFGFYASDHRPPGDLSDYIPSTVVPYGSLVAPELEIFTTSTANPIANLFRGDVQSAQHHSNLGEDRSGRMIESVIHFDFSDETAVASDPQLLLSRLDLLLCHGTLAPRSAAAIARVVAEETQDRALRAKGAILAVLTSPDCAVDG